MFILTSTNSYVPVLQNVYWTSHQSEVYFNLNPFCFQKSTAPTLTKRQVSKGVDLPPIYEKPEMPSHHESLSDDDFDLPHDQEVPSAFDSGKLLRVCDFFDLTVLCIEKSVQHLYQ